MSNDTRELTPVVEMDAAPAPCGVQPSLLDPQAAPVPFALTARARRVVAPGSLPALAVVVDHPPAIQEEPAHEGLTEDDQDLADPRRARARALRRAGSRLEVIAIELDLPIEVIERWTEAVAPSAPAVRKQVAVAHREEQELPAAYVTGRVAARASWRRGTPAMGAAMVAGMAEVTPFAVRLRGELATVAGVLQWLRDSQGIADRSLRVQVQASPEQSMDMVAHSVAARLQLPVDQVQARSWGASRSADTQEVLVRVADPHLAGTIAGWREELLDAMLRATAMPTPQLARSTVA